MLAGAGDIRSTSSEMLSPSGWLPSAARWKWTLPLCALTSKQTCNPYRLDLCSR